MRQYTIKFSPSSKKVSIEEVLDLARQISGESLDIKNTEENYAYVKLEGCVSIEITIGTDEITILQHGLLKSYLVRLFMYCFKELGIEVDYKIPYWAKKTFRKISKWEIWLF